MRDIHDAAGRRVRTIISGEGYPAGRHTFRWDGKDAGGQSVGSGVYLIRLRAGGEVFTQKAVLLK